MAARIPSLPDAKDQVEMAVDWAAEQAARQHPDTQALKEQIKGQMLGDLSGKKDTNTQARETKWTTSMGQNYGPKGKA